MQKRARTLNDGAVHAERGLAAAELRLALRHLVPQRRRVELRMRLGLLVEAQRLRGARAQTQPGQNLLGVLSGHFDQPWRMHTPTQARKETQRLCCTCAPTWSQALCILWTANRRMQARTS